MLWGVAVFGAAVGGLTGLIGAGGAIVAVPILVFVFQVPLPDAITTSLMAGVIIPLAALVPRLRTEVDWRTVVSVGGAGIAAAVVGTYVGTMVPEAVTLALFAVLMIASGFQMLRSSRDPAPASAPSARWWLRGVLVGLLSGFLTGLLGVGGGFIVVPALVLLLSIPFKLAVGSSLAITVINASAGLVAHAGVAPPDWRLTLSFVIPAAITALISARLARKVPTRVLRMAFGVLVLLIAIATLVQTVLSFVT